MGGPFQATITLRSTALPEASCGYLLQELQKIWDEVGEDQIERDKALQDIEQECLEVYRRKVDYANMARSRLHQELAESESESTRLLLSLGEHSLPQRPEKKAGTLRQQIDSITPALREMRLRKQERISQFHIIQGQIQKIKAEIAGLSEYDNSATTVIVNETDLSLKKLEEYQTKLQKLQKEKSNRLHRVERYADRIRDLAALLGMDSSMTITNIHPSLNELYGIAKNISDNTLTKLDDAVSSLEGEKQQRLDKVYHLGNLLSDMWSFLDTPAKERQQFLHVTNLLVVSSESIIKPGSLTPSIIQQAEAEVERLEEVKASKMKELFLIKQYELQDLCRKSHMEIPSPSEIENLTHLVHSGSIDLADLLTKMDKQITKAKEEAFSRKAIMERVEKWMIARDEERWLEEYNRDENRYSVSRCVHKNLKRAERARMTVTKIPALVDTLILLTKGWEDERKKVFMYDEEPLLAMVEEYIILRQEKEHENQRHRIERKKAVGEQSGMLVSPRPSTSGRHIPGRRLSGNLNNSSPTNRSMNRSPSIRRLSVGAQKTGWSNYYSQSPKEGQKSFRELYCESDYGSHRRDETASVVSTFSSGPLSPDM